MAIQLKASITNIACVGFAPPPCTTQRIAAKCNGYVTAVVADDDMART
jgi:hypothetical protein